VLTLPVSAQGAAGIDSWVIDTGRAQHFQHILGEDAMIPDQSMALGAPLVTPNGTAPRCRHFDGLVTVPPQSADCQDCQDCLSRDDRNDPRASLVVCLTCGWVACSDDSPNQHARAHYEETDHPVAVGLAPATAWRWCYVHQRRV
jgi:Zn-finger in ubiquitin-hydrolases and other protein